MTLDTLIAHPASTLVLYPLVAWIGVAIVRAILHPRLIAFLQKKEAQDAENVVSLIEKPLSWLLILLALRSGWASSEYSEGEGAELVGKLLFLLIAVSLTLLARHLLTFLFAAVLEPIAAKTEGELDDQIISVLKSSTGFLVWIVAGVAIISGFGFDIMGLVAGLGIGGLAFALAAKDTLSQAFSGVIIFLDRPFGVGDSIKVAGEAGTVKQIGLRSTRLRGFDKTEIILPNAVITASTIINLSRREGFRQALSLGLLYDTSPDLIRKAKETLEQIIEGHPDTQDECWVNFLAFGDSSLDLEVIYWIELNSGKGLRDVRHEVNLSILEQFNALGLGFAFPTVTLDPPPCGEDK
ncbi:mechanosensitive ion channel family protein [bacterium]|nr:mechanosensitive ion channel family protein [bacterium]